MEYRINVKNLTVTEDLKAYVEKRFSKFSKYFTDDTEIHVTLSRTRDDEKAEVTIPVKGSTIRAEETTKDIFTSIDNVQEIVERQLRRNRQKLIDRRQSSPSFSPYFTENQDGWEAGEEDEIRIVRSKRFAIKPMDPEEACFQMDISGHSFYVFRNSETDQVNVVYRRKDGDFGLIEPED